MRRSWLVSGGTVLPVGAVFALSILVFVALFAWDQYHVTERRDLEKGELLARVLVDHATRTLEAGQTESLRVPAIRTEGVYEFVCTFPGHWTLMYGQLVMTNDVDAYLKANPLASPAPAAAEHHEHGK